MKIKNLLLLVPIFFLNGCFKSTRVIEEKNVKVQLLSCFNKDCLLSGDLGYMPDYDLYNLTLEDGSTIAFNRYNYIKYPPRPKK